MAWVISILMATADATIHIKVKQMYGEIVFVATAVKKELQWNCTVSIPNEVVTIKKPTGPTQKGSIQHQNIL